MDVQTNGAAAPDAAPAIAPVTTPAPPPAPEPVDDSPLTLREAAELRIQRRAKPRDETGKFAPKDAPQAAPGEQGSAEQADAAPPPEANGETEAIDPAQEPPIDPPKSWSKQDRELWAKLDRDVQQRLLARDSDDTTAVRKAQQDAAEHRKAAEAERQKANEARQEYESKATATLRLLMAEQARDFPEVKSQEDITKLANDDPFRFVQWQARQEHLRGLQTELSRIQDQKSKESQQQFAEWSAEQDKKFGEQFKEFADAEKGPKTRQEVISYLTEQVGVEKDALQGLWSHPMFRDARMQRIVYDAARFHAAQEKAKSAVAAPKPPVQKPGIGQGRADGHTATIAALDQKLASAKTTRQQIEAASALRAAKRAAGK